MSALSSTVRTAPAAARQGAVWSRTVGIEAVSGRGCTLSTADGTDYLDFTAGIAVASTGHCHPAVVAAIQEQAAQLIHAQTNIIRHPVREALADRLASITPGAIDSFFFANSGAEAVEGAVKLAKQASGKPNVVVFDGSFHGRTHLTMAMTTSKKLYRAGYGPLPSGVYVAPFPRDSGDVGRALAGFETLLATQSAPSETAAAIIEPVLGEGGYIPAPRDFLVGLQRICRDNGILLVADEVQSGFGRTGRMFAVEHAGLEPDIVVMAKGMASGFPISAIGASRALMDRWPEGSHGSTYGGNPVGCAAALATIDVLTEPGFLDRVAQRGEQLVAGLRAACAADDGIAAVRGLGLMVALELTDAQRAAEVVRLCRDRDRLLVMTAGWRESTLRLMPPLVVTEAECATATAAIAKALEATR